MMGAILTPILEDNSLMQKIHTCPDGMEVYSSLVLNVIPIEDNKRRLECSRCKALIAVVSTIQP